MVATACRSTSVVHDPRKARGHVNPQGGLFTHFYGEERQNLEVQITAPGLSAHIEFLGNWNNIRQLINGFDVFMPSSLGEPIGLVIAEAVARGKRVIATNVGRIPEIVDDEVTGVLVRPADADRLADALIDLVWNEDRRREMGRAGRQRLLGRFDARIMFTRYEARYERLLSDYGQMRASAGQQLSGHDRR